MHKRSLFQLFNSLQEIDILAENACDKIDTVRKDFFYTDESIVECISKKCDSINSIEDGRSSIDYKGAHYELFFKRSDSNKLLVTFDGARTSDGGKIREIPYFPRWSWYPYIDANFLCIEDPMYYKFKELKLGWFYGTDKESYIQYTAEIILAISRKYNISVEDIILYGSSGGGTVSIMIGSLIKGVKVVALNAQVELLNFSYTKEFMSITGIDLTNKDCFFRNNTKYMIDNAPSTSYCLLYNIRSKEDITLQAAVLAKKMNITLKYGMTCQNNLTFWLYDAPSSNPHTALDNYIMYYLIRFYIDNGTIINQFDTFVNEIWRNLNFLSELRKKRVCTNNYYFSENDRANLVKECYIKKFIIEAVGNYSHRVLVNRLECGALYHLRIGKVIIEGAEKKEKIGALTIVIYDNDKKEIEQIFNIENYEKIDLYFETEEESNNCSLLLYGGEIGKTSGNILVIEDVLVEKIGYL